MNKKLLQAITLFMCFLLLTACGNNGAQSGASNSEGNGAAEEVTNLDAQDKEETGAEAKTDLTEKYGDVLEALENEEYAEAIDLIKAMMPEPEKQVVEINLENWTDFFSIESESHYSYDAMKNVIDSSESWYLVLKPEYMERLISISGEAGVEGAYEDEIHKVTAVDITDGSYETKVIDYADANSEYKRIMNDSDGLYFYDSEFSATYELFSDVYLMDSEIQAFEPDTTFPVSGILYIKDADEWTQYIRYPKINIVRIEGELVLSM